MSGVGVTLGFVAVALLIVWLGILAAATGWKVEDLEFRVKQLEQNEEKKK